MTECSIVVCGLHDLIHTKAISKNLVKPPTAGLWVGQTDEGEFGFSYETADKILYLYSEKKLSQAQIISKGYDKKIVERLWLWYWIEIGLYTTKERILIKL